MLSRFVNKIPGWIWLLLVALNLCMIIFNSVSGSIVFVMVNAMSCMLCLLAYEFSRRTRRSDK